jgi:hypothetical protein
MGREIDSLNFKEEEFDRYHKRLQEETFHLKKWFDQELFCDADPWIGVEIEGWLIDENRLPSPSSEEFLKAVNHYQVVPEISRFNFEINSSPFPLEGNSFSRLKDELDVLWEYCAKGSNQCEGSPLMIGTLATLRPHMLDNKYLSPNNRYHAMNNEVLRLRNNRPMRIHLTGRDVIDMDFGSVIAECAATSLQIHLGVTQANAKRYYNASLIASSFLIALSANSPYLFGKELWDESRIAIFEQAVAVDSFRNKEGEVVRRVTLGADYVKNCLMELFMENLDGHPVLLPVELGQELDDLEHLKLHNGTIWRWTRPIVGKGSSGKPGLRIEQRTPSSGPTIVDSIANSMFFIGLTDYLAQLPEPIEDTLEFKDMRNNFYSAARLSFDGDITWYGKKRNIQEVIINDLLGPIKEALKKRNVDVNDINFYFDKVIDPRLKHALNGARWQKAFIHTHGEDFQDMIRVYKQNQESGRPVGVWKV